MPRTPKKSRSPIWKGSIVFGLVEIPVELFSAERSGGKLKFTYLDRRDFSPVGYERVSKKTGAVVPWEEIVRGYEYEKGKYVVLNEQDFERANPKASRTIEIEGFAGRDEIDHFLYEKPYYLQPLKKNSKGYALLRQTLLEKHKVGIARFVMHTRQHLAVLDVRGPALALDTLRFAHELDEPEVVDTAGGDPKKLKVTSKEIDMAGQIVEGMTIRWDPGKYKDDYHDDLLAVIRDKVKKDQTREIEEPSKSEEEPRLAEVVDLMPLLKRSVEKTRGGREASPRRKAKKPGRGA